MHIGTFVPTQHLTSGSGEFEGVETQDGVFVLPLMCCDLLLNVHGLLGC